MQWNTRNTTNVTKEKIAVPRTEIRRLALRVQIQLQENGFFRITLFLTYIKMQSNIGCLVHYMNGLSECELP